MDLLDEVAWWQSDFWRYAAGAYIRAVAAQASISAPEVCRSFAWE